MPVTLTIVALFLYAQSFVGQNKSDTSLQVREEDGGSIAIHTANGLMNQDSSIKRRWCMIDDLNSPAGIDHAGIYPRFDEKENLQFLQPAGVVSPRQAISAIEVRYVLFDVWGQHLRTLSLTRLVDSSTHLDLRTGINWPALDSEVSQLVVSVAFVARVRDSEGEVWTFDANRILPTIKNLGVIVTAADLVPDEQRIVQPGVIYWTYAPRQDDSAVRAAGVIRP